MKVIFAQTARQDLADIARYLARENPSRAKAYVEELRSACFEIGEMPTGFERLDKTELVEMRRRTFQPYLIFYRATETQVRIVRIIHGARDYLKILDG